MAIRTILVPLDGSELSERALPFASRFAAVAEARLLLFRAVSVMPLPGFDNWHAQQREEEAARAELERTAAGLRQAGLEVDTQVESGDAGWAIARAAEETAAD